MWSYVDDMIITGDDMNGINYLKLQLAKQFKMKDLGTLYYFLGIEVAYSPRGYLFFQSKYIANILEHTRLSNTKVINSHLKLNVKYDPSDGVPLSDPTLYRTLVDNLVYLTITRPDIAYHVHVVSQFVVSPTIVHWEALLRICSYLRGTRFQSLLFPSPSSLELRAYSDADWRDNPTDRNSITIFCAFLGDSLIS
ncbi:uncharacterized mitochondrial protein AtMg00810-like [Lathyrus oleraceus]|uniref:uncharacterized mitochondrial protein AtMg00810-like n=1 Tax=Pisum sativum TaxID=3888 RepID=UPI0021D0A626|nr:uncharacterized mitochondrial protein AtMg00810-like [Pisum sativum]